MLDIKFIRENVDLIKENSKNRSAEVDVDKLLEVDKQKREIESALEALRADRNKASKTRPTTEVIEGMKKVGIEIKNLEEKLEIISEEYNFLLAQVPNLTHPEVKISQNEEDCPILGYSEAKAKEFDFEAKDHVQLAEQNDLIDFERGTKVAGAKFFYLKNELVLLELALTRYAFDIVMSHGYTPFTTPDLAKKDILANMGYNPRGESTQVYSIENSDLCLVGTAEITMGGYHKDEILKEADLPKKYAALSHCFRTEAGSYSKFSKGIFRVHQFTKIEMFQYVLPEESEKAHQEALNIEREIFDGLKVPYRVIDHVSGDLGTPSIRTFDLEAWMPGKPNKEGKSGDWAEVTSTSNCTDYQSRGVNIKYEGSDGKKQYVHLINGTAIAMTRLIIAIMENFQNNDGSIDVPEALQKYTGFSKIGPR